MAKIEISVCECEAIAEQLGRDANVIATYHDKHRDSMPDSVTCALLHEMTRLRGLADKIKPARKEESE